MKYLTAPLGYDLTGQPIEMNDTESLRNLAHGMVGDEAKDFHDSVDKMKLEDLQQFFIENGHTFE